MVYFVWFLFFFNDTATTEIYTLSLHDALPICASTRSAPAIARNECSRTGKRCGAGWAVARIGSTSGRSTPSSPSASARRDRKSTRLNSSHSQISYAVFCLKKKNRQVDQYSHTP